MYCAISQNNVTMDYGLWYEIIWSWQDWSVERNWGESIENASGGHRGQASGQALRNRTMRLHDYTITLANRSNESGYSGRKNSLFFISRFALLDDDNLQRLLRHTHKFCVRLSMRHAISTVTGEHSPHAQWGHFLNIIHQKFPAAIIHRQTDMLPCLLQFEKRRGETGRWRDLCTYNVFVFSQTLLNVLDCRRGMFR